MSHARYRWNTPMARRQEMRGISEEPSAACFAPSPSRGACRGGLRRSCCLAASARESERARGLPGRPCVARSARGASASRGSDERTTPARPAGSRSATSSRGFRRPRLGSTERRHGRTRRHSERATQRAPKSRSRAALPRKRAAVRVASRDGAHARVGRPEGRRGVVIVRAVPSRRRRLARGGRRERRGARLRPARRASGASLDRRRGVLRQGGCGAVRVLQPRGAARSVLR